MSKYGIYPIPQIRCRLEADLTEAEKEELLQMAKNYSPVYNSIKDSVKVSVQLDK